MQGETVLFNPQTKKFCVLNETAAFLWDQLDQPRTEAELRERLLAEFDGVNESLADQDVRTTLKQFTDLDITIVVE